MTTTRIALGINKYHSYKREKLKTCESHYLWTWGDVWLDYSFTLILQRVKEFELDILVLNLHRGQLFNFIIFYLY